MVKRDIDPADARLLAIVEDAFRQSSGKDAGKKQRPDPDTVSIVAACAGLLACVAYADREFGAVELTKTEQLLAGVGGLTESGRRAIVAALRAHVVELSSVHAVRFARTLKELGDRDLRLHVLVMLLELAAADDHISPSEVNALRQVTRALGLSQEDYNGLQSQHREKLASLR
jgi:uncharacterized tellurite resistance protein B-like protein